jgi:hypothetical protein
MNEDLYTIELADGSVINRLRLNVNNFVSDVPIDEKVFSNKLREVKITGPNGTTVMFNAQLVQIQKQDNGDYWFILREIPADELEREQMKSDIEYLAMLMGEEL